MQRQANLCELKVSLVYRVSSRTDSVATEKPVSKNARARERDIKFNVMYLRQEILVNQAALMPGSFREVGSAVRA